MLFGTKPLVVVSFKLFINTLFSRKMLNEKNHTEGI